MRAAGEADTSRRMVAGTLKTPNIHARPRAIANWLMVVAVLVFSMVVIGGITRLTESGLSITEWQLLTGIVPPMSESGWLAEFRKYQQIPEYSAINAGMTLADFKFIYFWEWTHRFLGRLIGLAFALPFFWFLLRRAIPMGYTLRLAALLALGALQGAIGWWMVTSGLSVRTDVSHFRLAVHLLTALFILAGLVWTALDLYGRARHPSFRPSRIGRLGIAVIAILFVQLLFGAFTAGLNAGYVSSSWPLMNERLFPAGVDWAEGFWNAITNDPFLIHFIHRWWAWVVLAALIVLARRVKHAGVREASIALHSAVGLQFLLGIATVLTGVHIWLAVAHQAVGALVVAATAWSLHVVGRRRIR